MENQQQFRPAVAAEIAGINPITLRGWIASDGFAPEAKFICEANEILKHIPQNRRRPLEGYTWTEYTENDLIRLAIIAQLRALGWNLDASLAAIGQRDLSPDGRPVNTMVITRNSGEYHLSRFAKESEAARFAAQQSQSGVATFISVAAIRNLVQKRLSELERDREKTIGDGKAITAQSYNPKSAGNAGNQKTHGKPIPVVAQNRAKKGNR
jgi:DNA-binding transcriptional MerR regulator